MSTHQSAPAAMSTAPPAKAAPIASPNPAKTGEPIAIVVRKMPDDDHGFDYLNMGVSGFVGLVAALLGAVIGNHLTRKTASEARQRDEDERTRFAAFAMRHKLMKVYSSLTAIRDVIQPAWAEAEKRKAAGQIWHPSMIVRGSANQLFPVTFSEDEFYRTARLAGPESINAIMLLDEHYNSRLNLLERYSQERVALEAAFVGPLDKDGSREIKWTEEVYAEHQALLVSLDQLLGIIMTRMDDDRKNAFDAIVKVWAAENSKFSTGRMEIRNPDGVKQVYGPNGLEEPQGEN